MGMHEFAKHILAVADQRNLSCSNLQLQKVMYFAIKDYLDDHPGEDGLSFVKEMYDLPFKTWDYGPLIPSIYHEYGIYGNTSIPENGTYQEKYKDFDQYIANRLNKDIFDLVKESHQQPLWSNNQKEILNRSNTFNYRIEDIVE
ncbi:Panacea domain-containing protein [Xylocopilactobacillus apicola]|uniref:Antitoxin SocA-like Panacea domain-containing protein n=1 Tax=Xylocopilactobacillus apicola TaxID=2932184 RepID=A0AAU9DHD4_9LACO|nr:type II toxin-antitoxin system antitoxin SocA domain-containing protein [Xylocopilactobacillus apicola]BDR59400.1 hypothetical protein XA3_18410 [Xylocopilactobacillus apicola]